MDDAGIQADVSQLRSTLSDLDRRMGMVSDGVASLDRRVTRLQSDFSEFAAEIRRNRVMDAARDRRDDLDRELKEKFGLHEGARRLAASIIHAVSTGVIDDAVILDTAQRRMVELPDYWLAPTIVAVAAWLSRDQGKCDEALRLALSLDRSKTALFMTLLLRHHDRGPALQQWIDAYLADLEPRNLPADFQVVIDAVAGGALGDGSAPKLANWMATRYLAETQSRDAWAEATGEWQRRLQSMGAIGEFAPTLARSCQDWQALQERHSANVMIEKAERHFRDRFEQGASVSADLTERMRELVTKLARTPDPEEERLRRERRLEDAVYQTGDRQAAQRRLTSEEVGRTGSLNILSLVAASAFPASSDGKLPGPTVTELLTIVLSRELIASAAGTVHDGTQRPAAIKVRVGRFPERECVFSCETDAEVTPEALAEQAAAHVTEVKAQVKQEADEHQNRLRKFRRRPLPVALGSSAVVAAVPFVVPTGVPAFDFVAPAVVVAAGAVSWLTVLLGRKHRVQSTSAREIPAISKALEDTAAELATFFAQEQRSARLRTDLQQFLRQLTPNHAYRVVRPVDSRPFVRSREFPEWTPLPPDHPGLWPPDDSRRLS
jgi:hypothetical protein